MWGCMLVVLLSSDKVLWELAYVALRDDDGDYGDREDNEDTVSVQTAHVR